MGKIVNFVPKIDEKISLSNSIFLLGDYHKSLVKKEVIEILHSLEEDYELRVLIRPIEIDLILHQFYQYYVSKSISFAFRDTMIGHFEDLAYDAISYSCDIDLDFVLAELQLYELLDSQIEVLPKDTRRLVKNISCEVRNWRDTK